MKHFLDSSQFNLRVKRSEAPVTKRRYMTEQQRQELREKRLANLKPFSSAYQPKNRRSRKGISNRSTILKLALEAFERQEKRKREKGMVRCPSCRFRF